MASLTPSDIAFQNAGKYLRWKTQETGSTAVNGVPTAGNSGVSVLESQKTKIAVTPNSGATLSFRVWIEYTGRQGFYLADGFDRGGITTAWTQEINTSGASRLYVEVTAIDTGNFDVEMAPAQHPISPPKILPTVFVYESTFDEIITEDGANTVGLFVPDGSVADNIVDKAGTVTAGSYTSTGLTTDIVPDAEWGYNQWAVDQATTQANFALLGNVSARALYQYRGDTGNGPGDVVKADGAGETTANNGLYIIRLADASTVTWITEYGAGNNSIVDFALPSALNVDEIFLVSFSLTDNGDGTSNLMMYKNASRLSVSSGSGTNFVNNGDSATITTPDGDLSDTDARLRIGSSTSVNRTKFVQVRSTNSSDLGEQTFAQKFGFVF